MFEFSIALKYLIPRLRYLSVSIISIISILVIATVVWLTIVFFSTTDGLEKRWTEKLITITAPVRLLPTKAYYNSYYYLIDTVSEAAGYSPKTLSEKLHARQANPYDARVDQALPRNFPKPLVNEKKQLIDIAKTAEIAAKKVHGVRDLATSIFDTAFTNVRLNLIRQNPGAHASGPSTELLTQASYLMNFSPENKNLAVIMLPIRAEDRENIEEIEERIGNTGPLTLEKKGNLWQLPYNPTLGQGVLLPKSFRDSGVRIGDQGYFSYFAPTATSLQEQRLNFFVAGFYDPGIIPIGGKLILAPEDVVSLIQTASTGADNLFPTGINVSFANYKEAGEVKKQIQENLKKYGISEFFTVETYDQYDFTKDIFQQLKSERNLFSLISIIIVIVACSNIISMLVILVHDKQKEVAILRALGASKASIGLIFGFSGFLMGAIGSLIGACVAYFTVKNLAVLLDFLGRLQGFEVLNANYFGTTIPTEVSAYSVVLVVCATAIVSTLAGIVAAFKASHQNTSEALRSE